MRLERVDGWIVETDVCHDLLIAQRPDMYQHGCIGCAGLPYHPIPIDERHHFVGLSDEFIGGESLNFDGIIERLEKAHDFGVTTAGLPPLAWKMPIPIWIHPRGVFVDAGQDGGYIAMPKCFIQLLNHTYIALFDRSHNTPPVAEKSRFHFAC